MARRHRPISLMAAPVTRETLGGTEARAMQRAKGTQVTWRTVANGRPQGGGYVYRGSMPERDAEDTPLASEAWYAVALIQAQVWGEPAPSALPEPWNLRPCPKCRYQMHCRCEGAS